MSTEAQQHLEKTLAEIPAPRVHHPFSPSSLQSREACPCYEPKQNDTPHERTIAGTKAHAVAESGIDDNTLSDEDAAAAAECMDFVDKRKALLEEARKKEVWRLAVELADNDSHPDSTYRDADEDTEPVLEIKEEYWPVDDIPTMPGGCTTAGFADTVLVDHTRTRAEIIDHKFGRWYVEPAANNLQGMAYVLGVFKRFPTVERIKVFFKMPILEHLSEAEFTRADDWHRMYLRIRTVVERSIEARKRGDFSTANPGAPVCMFCANLGKCPAVAALALRVGKKFHPLGVPENITPSMLLSARDTLQGIELAQTVAIWAKAFRAQTTDRIIRGDADLPPGHKLQQKSNREVVSPEKYREVAMGYLTEEEYMRCCTVVFGSVEEIISDRAPRGSKKAAIEEFNAKLLNSGAVKKGDPYTFLKSVSEKAE